MRIALVVGHNSSSKGAVRVTDGVSEWVWNQQLANEVKKQSPFEVAIFYRDPRLGYASQIKKVYKETDAWNADVTVELHFNSFSSPSASGTEVYYRSSRGKLFADRVQAGMLDALGLKDRGVIQRRKGRGALSLSSGKAPAILIEPYFGSNPSDCQSADANFNKLAKNIFSALKGPSAQVPAPSDDWEERVMKWLLEFPKRV